MRSKLNFFDVLNILEVSNTTSNIVKVTSVNSPQNTCIRNPRIYIYYSLSLLPLFICKVKEMMLEGLFDNFWISNGAIIKIRKSAGLTSFSMTHENDLILEYYYRFDFRIVSFLWVIFIKLYMCKNYTLFSVLLLSICVMLCYQGNSHSP